MTCAPCRRPTLMFRTRCWQNCSRRDWQQRMVSGREQLHDEICRTTAESSYMMRKSSIQQHMLALLVVQALLYQTLLPAVTAPCR